MRLKALELHGFKSFPDKTVLNFDSDITVVVGPNGSGKSNISDAVRWVLGELSSKIIRGTKMEDIIFGGSDNRRPMGYAEASVIIDNTTGLGRLDMDYDEVTVTRRYFRNGESEYLLNRRPVRLRDITELFMNTGVGKTGYSIIGQGKIAEIISQKSDERRNVFEEAAGISKYRFKKHEAERKLKEVDDNSLRLGDIISELAARIGPLEKESAKAREYLEIYDRKKEIDVSLWLYDVSAVKEKLEEAEKRYVSCKLELEEADRAIAAIEAKSDKLYLRSQQTNLESEQTERRIRELLSKRSSMESAEKVLENDISHISEQKLKLEAEGQVIASEREAAEKRTAELCGERTARSDELAALRGQLSANESERLASTASFEAKEKEISEKDELLRTLDDELTALKIKLSALEGSRESSSGRGEDIDSELGLLGEDMKLLSDRIARAELSVRDYSDKAAAFGREKDELDARAAELNEKKDRLLDECNKLRLEQTSKQQRADSLRRMEELFEGFVPSVKRIMKASEQGELSGICGPVSHLIKVPSKYGMAVETALGAGVQNIVVENENSAKAAIEYLKRNNAGRATFYPITSVKAQNANMQKDRLASMRGYIGIADELAECDGRYRDVIASMLGRTAVFDNIDNATSAAKAMGFKVRLVTLDGQMINAGGSFTGGSARRESGILTRSTEIEKLSAELDAIKKKLVENEKASEDAKRELSELARKQSDVEAQIILVNSLSQAEQTQLEVLRVQYDGDESRKNVLLKDLENLGEQSRAYKEEHERLSREIEDAEGRCLECRLASEELLTEQGNIRDTLDGIAVLRERLMLDITAKEKDIEAISDNISQSEASAEALEARLSNGKDSIAALDRRRSEAASAIESNRRDSGALDDEMAQCENRRDELREASANIEKEQNELRDELKNENHKREIIFRDYTKSDAAREQTQTEQTRLSGRLWDEYELTYADAVALEYPAVTAETRAGTVVKQSELRSKLKSLGNVNVSAIDEYAEVKERYEFTDAQYKDLCRAREELTDVIEKLEKEMREKFLLALENINRNFKRVFRELFGGGNAEVLLSNPDDVLTSGIEINVAPPGKIIKSLSLLSGGEQAFVAIALIFAILNVNPTPFCIFDEIEAALDEVNVERYADYMKKYSAQTQFIAITHRRGTMEKADVLYGVTMPERGVSRVLSVDVNEAEKKLGIEL